MSDHFISEDPLPTSRASSPEDLSKGPLLLVSIRAALGAHLTFPDVTLLLEEKVGVITKIPPHFRVYVQSD